MSFHSGNYARAIFHHHTSWRSDTFCPSYSTEIICSPNKPQRTATTEMIPFTAIDVKRDGRKLFIINNNSNAKTPLTMENLQSSSHFIKKLTLLKVQLNPLIFPVISRCLCRLLFLVDILAQLLLCVTPNPFKHLWLKSIPSEKEYLVTILLAQAHNVGRTSYK